MKAIMKTIKPKTCANIMNLIQSVLVIKNKKEANAVQKLIDEYGYAEIYVYCTKNGGCIGLELGTWKAYYLENGKSVCSGKVLFKFRCYKVEEIAYQRVFEQNPFHFLEEESGYGTKTINATLFKKTTCLTDKELEDYLNTDKPNQHAYVVHVSNLEIFDRPRELCEFYTINKAKSCSKSGCPYFGTYNCKNAAECSVQFKLTKAPQNFCYVEVE